MGGCILCSWHAHNARALPHVPYEGAYYEPGAFTPPDGAWGRVSGPSWASSFFSRSRKLFSSLRPSLTSHPSLPSQYHQYHIVGRHVPTDAQPEPQIYRMKLWSLDDTRAKSKFWCVKQISTEYSATRVTL